MNRLLEIYYDYKKQIIIGLLAIFLITISIIYFKLSMVKEDSEPIDVVVEDNKDEELIEETEEERKIKVNVKGAINNPGVYELDELSRVIDAIEISGGLTKNADTSFLNLSKKLNDESVIIVYTKDEVKKIKDGNTVIEYIEKDCNCPYIQNNACIDQGNIIGGNNSTVINNNSKISINKATEEELQTLPGIGTSKAKDIIEYRKNNGEFKTIEDILNVKGIGDALFEKIKDNITI